MKVAVVLLICLVSLAHGARPYRNGRFARDDFLCKDPDCGKNTTELILSKGYPAEEYQVQTSDGYLLGVQRIPHGKNNTGGGPAVLLQHGLEDASHTWVINFPEQSLGFILADAGYDVWLGNNRGNVYSKNHVSLDPNSEAFWQFSFDEMGSSDLPAMLDFIREATGQDQVIHIGHSEGTMQGFIGYQNQTTASKVKLFVALAPVAYIGDITSRFFQLLAKLDVATILSVFGVKEFLPSTPLYHDLADAACDLSELFCNIVLCAMAGCNPDNLNATRFDVYFDADPAGTSVQNMVHFQQGVKRDNWCMQDFGYFGNKQHYGTHHYPCYDLSQVIAPTALYTGGRDKLADPTDVTKIKEQMNPSKIVHEFNIDEYEHMDFIWGLDAHQKLYPDVVELLQKYSPTK